MLSKSFKSGKCKTSLKLAVSRIKLLKNRREIQVKQLRRELAQLLANGQEQTARIRVEHVIREEKTMSAYELIEIYCELIVARLPIIESQKTCPIDLKEAITSVIFASPRCSDIPELMDARKHFVAKYGKEFVTSSLELRPDCGVSRMIVEKLSAKAPDIELKIKTLTAIAKEHDVKWDSKAFENELQKPTEDMLNGPSNFTSANKMPRESLNVNFSPDANQKESAPKDFQKDVLNKPTSFKSHANFRTSNLVAPPTHDESRASETKAGKWDVTDSYPSDEMASLNQPTWRMEFEDAASAAQVAAESAERASMAARAAAVLASRGNISRQNSDEPNRSSVKSSRNEGSNRVGNSNLKGEHSDSLKNGYQGMRDEVHRLPGDELRKGISHSSRTSAEDDMEFSTSHIDNMKKFDGDRESFSRTKHMGYKKTNDEPGFAKENVEVNYDRSASANSIGTFGNDTIWVPPIDKPQTGNHDTPDFNSPAEDRFSSYFNDQIVSNDYPGTVFDEYDPEPYDSSGNLLDSFSRKQDDQASIFDSNTNVVNSKNSFSDSTSDSHPIVVEKVPPPKFDDNRPLTFDESDGSCSESETENNESFHNETVRSSSLLQEHRVFGSDSFSREESMPLNSSKTKPIIGTEEKDQLELSSSLGIRDSEISYEYASGGELGLNFGRLTGGFRNRGYCHPPYTASSVINSSMSSKDIVGSAFPSTEPIVSQLDKPLTRTRTAGEERCDQDSSWKDYPSSSIMLRASNLESGKAKEFDSEEHIQGSRDSKNSTTDKSEEDSTSLSFKQFEYHGNSRSYRGDDQNPSKQPDPSESAASNTSEVFNPAKAPTSSKVTDPKIYELKPRSKAYKDLSSRMSRIDVDSDGDGRDSESQVNMESKRNANANTNVKLSRRTRDFPSNSRSNPPRSTRSSDISNSDTGSQSTQGSSAIEPISQTVDEARTFHGKQIHSSLKPTSSDEHPVQPMPVASIQNDKKSPGQDSDSGRGTTLGEDSLKKASHIHPKLPDYDTLAAHFQSLRSNLR